MSAKVANMSIPNKRLPPQTKAFGPRMASQTVFARHSIPEIIKCDLQKFITSHAPCKAESAVSRETETSIYDESTDKCKFSLPFSYFHSLWRLTCGDSLASLQIESGAAVCMAGSNMLGWGKIFWNSLRCTTSRKMFVLAVTLLTEYGFGEALRWLFGTWSA